MFERFPFVDVAFGPGQVHRLAEFLTSDSLTAQGYFEFEGFTGELPARRERPYQGWLQISVGCNCVCSYCIVPSTRGREVSRPLEELVAEVRGDGRRRRPRGHAARPERQLLRARPARPAGAIADARQAQLRRTAGGLDAIDGIERIRYTSPHPKDMREDVIRAHAELPERVRAHPPAAAVGLQPHPEGDAPHLRPRALPRSRGADPRARPRRALTTDIIVGFPGETEEDFEQTLEVVEEVGYDSAFTFVFSPRRGTEAAEIERRRRCPTR